jgi:hypothetical protein
MIDATNWKSFRSRLGNTVKGILRRMVSLLGAAIVMSFAVAGCGSAKTVAPCAGYFSYPSDFGPKYRFSTPRELSYSVNFIPIYSGNSIFIPSRSGLLLPIGTEAIL